ncbi:hypothetical protein VNO77_19706 [Canavalia gladiata]|uniref:Uncharacterized protein n=1 Tax=Canavalia gladiata TaxID=3824 RepID=A0AAN9QPV8_CANGL
MGSIFGRSATPNIDHILASHWLYEIPRRGSETSKIRIAMARVQTRLQKELAAYLQPNQNVNFPFGGLELNLKPIPRYCGTPNCMYAWVQPALPHYR